MYLFFLNLVNGLKSVLNKRCLTMNICMCNIHCFPLTNTLADFHNNIDNKKVHEMRLETFKYLSHPRYFLFNKILVSLYDISKARTERHLGLVCKQNVSSARHQVVCSSLKSVNHLGGVLFDCFFVRKKPVLEEPFFKFLLTKKKMWSW